MPRYSDTLMDYFQSPRNEGELQDATRTGTAGVPGAGRYIHVHVSLKNDRVERATFQSHGCGVTIACASAATVLAIGRTREECLQLTAEDITNELDGLPADKGHCAEFALAALRNALEERG